MSHTKTAPLQLYLTPEDKRKYQEFAYTEGRTLNGEIRYLLDKAIDDRLAFDRANHIPDLAATKARMLAEANERLGN